MKQQTSTVERTERLDYAELWMRDGLAVAPQPGFFQSIDADMTRCKALIETKRRAGVRLTYTHLFVKAAALVLSRHSELHQMVSGSRRLVPGQVDIGLSVAGSIMVAPVVIIVDAAHRAIEDIAEEVIRRAPEVRTAQDEFLAMSRRWGWIAPFGWMRRFILRQLLKRLSFKRTEVGTFQVSCLAGVDQFVPFLFSTSAILGTGRVKDRPVVANGNVEIRPTVTLSCCADHKVWDGMAGAVFLAELKEVLESGLEVRSRPVANDMGD